MNQNYAGRTALLALLVVFLIAGAFSGGVLVGRMIPAQTNEETSESDILFEPFWETWQYVQDGFINQPVDDNKLMQGAIRGMLESLDDKHTSYMDPEEYKEINAPLDGAYEGIGAYVDVSGEWLTIISPMPGSPAEEKGLRPGDEVIKVNGEDVSGIDPSIVLRSVKGPAGSEVTLTIRRPESNEELDFTITRQEIKLESVVGEMLEDNIAYVYISTFGNNTADELRRILKTLLAEKPEGMILDLRYNSGGYVDAAVDIMSEFIAEGVVLIEQEGSGKETAYEAKEGGLATTIPLAVLVNEGTASAAEITAGAIQDYERGILVGTTTYGKGSVQAFIPLKNDQGAVRITIAKWLTPKGRLINEIGLTPDVEVTLTDADIDAEIDAQLEKAIEILRQAE